MSNQEKLTRGIRNNNPGNLRKTKDPWKGLAKTQTDKDFFVFRTPVYGIRALAKTLMTYYACYDLRTIRQIISRWAPASENNTEAYIKAVSESIKLQPDKKMDALKRDHLKALVEAIIHFENGQQPYTAAQIDKALSLAGI